jgi:DNA-binding transcriptional MerR regulator
MPSALLQINIVPKRLLKKSEAAGYCNRAIKRFETEFPYPPVRMPNGDRLYDREDCDRWIESLKTGTFDTDDIVGRLGQ